VLHGQAVPAAISWSAYLRHTDIIVKGGRDVQYGHKLNLVTARAA